MIRCECPPTSGCQVSERRRRLIGNLRWNGIDYVEVDDDQLSLCVHLFGRIPEDLTSANIRILGGRRIRDIRVTHVEIHRAEDEDLDDCLRVVVDRAGDFSPYCLCIVEPVQSERDACGFPLAGGEESRWRPHQGFDPQYACVEFTFKAGCPSPLDCAPASICEPANPPAPAINYLAKDYAGFRRLLLDRLAVTLPEWSERHVPDIGVAIVEVLAYAADRLSYYQDAVATEAYLATARRRISVRRHLRLIDYRLHEGCNARAWLALEAPSDMTIDAVESLAFATGHAALVAGRVPRGEVERLGRDAVTVFQPLLPRRGGLELRVGRNRIRFHTWGDHECCLPEGATRATLVDSPFQQDTERGSEAATPRQAGGRLGLKVSDVLIIEEVRGPTTGVAADADPRRRHAVRLTQVRTDRDELLAEDLLDVEWGEDDALPFDVCLSSTTSDCRRIDDVSVARGNVILVDHGVSREDGPWTVSGSPVPGPCACEGSLQTIDLVPEPLNVVLPRSPLTFSEPLVAGAPASALLRQDPRAGLPQVDLETRATAQSWRPKLDLLDSDADAATFVVEIEDDLTARLRFGDGEYGRRPEAGLAFDAHYRIGNGVRGNVGADSIVVVLSDDPGLDGLRIRNPLAATGGVDPEPVAEARTFGPGAIRRRRLRAVVDSDYTALAAASPGVDSACATMAWTGAGYEMDIGVDPLGGADLAPALREQVRVGLEPFRRLGHDLSVTPARYVPLIVELSVCVEDGYLAAHVLAALLARLGARSLEGRKGFFHPDNLRFGMGVDVSQLVAAAQSLDGVRHVEVTRLERAPGRTPPDTSSLQAGGLVLAPNEIARVDNDPNYPDNGVLTFVMRGGR
jgi:hypothetical protein